jgi:tetratricopeptide (TPR) repeat protein
MTPKRSSALFAIALSLAIALVYSFGLSNQLLFDDARLTDGTIFGQYGSLWLLKVRSLSYGSFVWVQAILGEGWAKQRGFNIALHIATALALYGLVLELLKATHWDDPLRQSAGFPSTLTTSARLGVALWALNPVAVYAVAYLIQRSIVMATLFVTLAMWAFVKGLVTHKQSWFLLSAACYVSAVFSKEFAVTSFLLLVPLYVFVKRPSVKVIVRLVAVSGLVMGSIGLVLYNQYANVIGNVFDETSRAHMAQLEQIQPGISKSLFPLSIINQASLFFQYGLMWLLPYVGWMSIDLRPAFPLGFLSWQMLGAIAYVTLLLAGLWLVWRRSNIWGLLGLCLLIPSLMFTTEFATVWLQDPLVLYRSYLWSMGVPVLLALLLVWLAGAGVLNGLVLTVGVGVAAALAGLSFERINSLQTPSTAWQDASAKIQQSAPANAVGRWRPFLNLGAEAMEKGDYNEAIRQFNQAEALGEPMGSARFNIGVSLQQLKQHPAALEQLAAAQAKGFAEAALFYHQGESHFAQRQFQQAYDSFSQALQRKQDPEAEQFTRLRQAEAAVGSNNFDAAVISYKTLIQQSPKNQRFQVGLAMAHIGKKDFVTAMGILNPAIAQRPTSAAHYARALAYFSMGDRAASKQDLDLAIRAEPNNPVYRQLEQMMSQPIAGAKASPKP